MTRNFRRGEDGGGALVVMAADGAICPNTRQGERYRSTRGCLRLGCSRPGRSTLGLSALAKGNFAASILFGKQIFQAVKELQSGFRAQRVRIARLQCLLDRVSLDFGRRAL